MSGDQQRPADYDLLLVPRASSNDDAGILVTWEVEDGAAVAAGDVVCEVEFSKAVIEVPAHRDGYVFKMAREGEEVRVGSAVAALADAAVRPSINRSSTDADGVKVTAKAKQLLEEHHLDLSRFPGLEIVREKHVRALLDRGAGDDGGGGDPHDGAEGDLQSLTPIHRRTASTVAHSKRSIPHSYLTRWISAASVDQHVEQIQGEEDMMVSISDLLVRAVARAAARWPKANAAWREDSILLYPHRHVGFALNQADGELVVPVIRHADTLPLEELVGRIRGMQKKAVRRKFAPDDLTGGTITVTSLLGTGAHQVFPIIVPDQSVIVALGERVDFGAAAAYCLTIAFDHRILNGAEAAKFVTTAGNFLYRDSNRE